MDINFLNNIWKQYLVVENYIFCIMYINIYLNNIIHHGIIHLSLIQFHSSTFMHVCSYVWKKHHKYITIRVNPIWNASKDWPPFEGLCHSLFPRKQRERGGAGPPSVFRMERLIVSIFSICYKTKFKRNERHVKLI